jgi:hypothetical protein
MNKIAVSLSIAGMALALVLAGGVYDDARAFCGISLPSFPLCCHTAKTADKDTMERDMDYSHGGVDRDLGIYLNTNVNEFGDDLAYNSFNGATDPDQKVRNRPYGFQPAPEEKGLFSYKRF